MSYASKYQNLTFEVATSKFLDRWMPAPIVLTCAIVTIYGAHPWILLVLSGLFVGSNIALNIAIDRRSRARKPVAKLVADTRVMLSLGFIPPIVTFAGPVAAGWLPLIPATVAVAALLPARRAAIVTSALVLVCAGLWLWVGAPLHNVLLLVFAMTAYALVALPLLHSLRLRARELVEMTRTLRQQNESLNAARHAAELATEAKSAFLAHMSHELRTPLSGMLGCLELLQESLGDPVQGPQLLSTAQRSGRGLVQIIDDVLDLSKIEAGRLSVEMLATDIPSVLRDVAALHTPTAQQNGVRIHVTIDPDIGWISTDPVRLRQILANLVGNATKFTQRGDIELSAHTVEDPTLIRFSVRDTGIGIAKENLPYVFQSFSQAEVATSRRFGGTGLGLALVKQLTQLLGGEVTVESTLGEGTTFHIDLPWLALDTPELETAANSGGIPELAPLRVLLVEDNRVNQMVATKLLERRGHRVRVADDGAVAMAILRDESFDVVLMDCNMPNLDGWQASTALREQGFVTPIIALTASTLSEERSRCRLAGMNGFVSKPIDPYTLFSEIERLLPATTHPQREPSRPLHVGT